MNFEGDGNTELDKHTDGSNLNSKVKSRLSSSVKYPFPVIVFFFRFSSCNVRFGIACRITITFE